MILSEYYKSKFFVENPWVEGMLEVVVLLILTFLLTFMVNVFCKRLIKQFEKTDFFWDDALVEAVRKPILFLIWMTAFVFLIEQGAHLLKITSGEVLVVAKKIIFMAAVAWFLFGLIKQVEKFWLERYRHSKSKLDPTSIGALTKVMNIVVVILTGLALMQSFGFSVSALLAFIGGGGIAAGFAAKDLMANFFGAVMIYMDRPFKVGDWVRSPDKEIEGHVENISLRATMIRTLDKRPLYVPNSVFNTISIENPSRMTHRRIMETIGVRHEDFGAIDKICKEAEKMLRSHKQIDHNLPIIINLNNSSLTSLNLLLMAFTKTTDAEMFHKIKQDIMLKVLEIIHSNEAKSVQITSAILGD